MSLPRRVVRLASYLILLLVVTTRFSIQGLDRVQSTIDSRRLYEFSADFTKILTKMINQQLLN